MEIKTALLETEKQLVKVFLNSLDLEFVDDIDYCLYAIDNNQVIGTISVSEDIIKYFAVSPNYQGENIAGKLISEMINYLYHKGIYTYKAYTKPKNKKIFESLNFREIITTDEVCLLESKNSNIEDQLYKLKAEYNIDSDDVGSIVMNCNPFTLGHQYLIKEASSRHKLVIVFILEEDKSFFSFQERINLVRAGTKDIKNVKVIPSTKYLVSSLTFPTYFLKKDVDQVLEQAKCDALIFNKYFMKVFNIKKRYLGTETDLVTNKYNQVLKTVLKDKVEVIERIKEGSENISASRVRELLKTKNFDEIKKLVPITTLRYLKSL